MYLSSLSLKDKRFCIRCIPIESDRALSINISTYIWSIGTDSPIANLRYPLMMRIRTLIKVEISTLASSPANYHRWIYGIIPLSRLALAETHLYMLSRKWLQMNRCPVLSHDNNEIKTRRYFRKGSLWHLDPREHDSHSRLAENDRRFYGLKEGFYIYTRRSFQLWWRAIANRIMTK